MRTAKITLDGQELEIVEKRHKANMEWIEKFTKSPVATLLRQIGPGLGLNLKDMTGLLELVQVGIGAILTTSEDIRALVVAYAPELSEVDAFDSEWYDALLGVISVVYPFGQAVKLLGVLAQSGLAPSLTSEKSASPSGTETSIPSTA